MGCGGGKNACLANSALPDALSRIEAELAQLCPVHMRPGTVTADQKPQQPQRSLHPLVIFVLFIDLENVR